MTGITREKASQVAASYLGGESLYLGTYYKTYAATDSQVLASGDRDHILSGVFNQFLSEKSEPAE